ncbi:MAG: hypothetical protein ACOX18_02085 [Bacillota bacterium]|jgi:hypothetical protein
MNRQVKRRQQRRGEQQRSWDLIIAGVVGALVLGIFLMSFLFPNLNLVSYREASPRVLRKIVERGIAWLEEDLPAITEFAYGYHLEDDLWANFQVEKSDDRIKLLNTDGDEVTEFAIGEEPEFYKDLGAALSELKAALKDKEFTLSFLRTFDRHNLLVLIAEDEEDSEKVTQYQMVFTPEHRLDTLIYYSTEGETPEGYTFGELYENFTPER